MIMNPEPNDHSEKYSCDTDGFLDELTIINHHWLQGIYSSS